MDILDCDRMSNNNSTNSGHSNFNQIGYAVNIEQVDLVKDFTSSLISP